MTPEEKRERRLQMLEDDIGRALDVSQRNGELRSAPSWGRPLQLGDGYAQTPGELRMGFKILKDANCCNCSKNSSNWPCGWKNCVPRPAFSHL